MTKDASGASVEIAQFSDPSSSLYKLQWEKDLSTLLTKLNKEFTFDSNTGNWIIPGANEEQMQKFSSTINFLILIQGITQAKHMINSNLDYVELAKDLSSLFDQTVTKNTDGSLLTPSPQQVLAIETLVNLMSSEVEDVENPYTSEVFSVFSILSGLFGTGKTAVVAPAAVKIAKKVLKLTDDQIVYSARTSTAANNLAKYVSKKDDAVGTTTDNLPTLNFDKVKLIVIDEAFQYAAADLQDLVRIVVEYNTGKPKDQRVRIFGLGDPSQVTLSPPHLFPLTQNSSYPVKYANSLTAIYRTGINSIADAALAFHLNSTPVTFMNTIANTTLEKVKEADSVDSFVGVVAGNSSFSGEEAILKMLAKKSTKTRLVITNNQNQANTFAKRLASSGINDPNILVKSYEDAQSMTVDQVYLMLDPQMSNAFNKAFTDFDYNTAMYTSIGRAKEFVFFANPNFAVAHIENDALANEKENLAIELELNKALFSSAIEAQNESIRILFEQTIPTSGVSPTTEEQAEEAEDDTEGDLVEDHDESDHDSVDEENGETDTPPTEPEPTTETTTGENVTLQHSLHYPSATKVSSLIKSGELVPGAQMRIVGQEDNSNQYGLSYHVMAAKTDGT
jgi:hypothetical protein